MRVLLTALAFALSCWAQSMPPQFEELHAAAVKQNPPGVRLILAISDGRTTFHVSDEIRFTLTFTSKQLHRYTVDLATGENTAASSEDFVFQGPQMDVPIHSRLYSTYGIVCCRSDRRYVGQQGVVAVATFSLKCFELPRLYPALPGVAELPKSLPAGDYTIFVQTRNLRLGWPKSDRERYHAVSDIVMTSENILHITILP